MLQSDERSEGKKRELDRTEVPVSKFGPDKSDEHHDRKDRSKEACPDAQDKCRTADEFYDRSEGSEPWPEVDRAEVRLCTREVVKLVPTVIDKDHTDYEAKNEHPCVGIGTFAFAVAHTFHSEHINF